jgi:hypothetical protein
MSFAILVRLFIDISQFLVFVPRFERRVSYQLSRAGRLGAEKKEYDFLFLGVSASLRLCVSARVNLIV